MLLIVPPPAKPLPAPVWWHDRSQPGSAGHRTAAFKPYNPRSPKLAAVQPDVIRTHSSRQRALIQKLRIPFVDFEPQFPGLSIPIQIEIAGELLRLLRFLRNASTLRRCALREQP